MKRKDRPVIVQGDTNTVFAGALAASKLGIKVTNVEAGPKIIRQNNARRNEQNVTDHCSDYLMAVSETQRSILLKRVSVMKKFSLLVIQSPIHFGIQRKYWYERNESFHRVWFEVERILFISSHTGHRT